MLEEMCTLDNVVGLLLHLMWILCLHHFFMKLIPSYKAIPLPWSTLTSGNLRWLHPTNQKPSAWCPLHSAQRMATSTGQSRLEKPRTWIEQSTGWWKNSSQVCFESNTNHSSSQLRTLILKTFTKVAAARKQVSSMLTTVTVTLH